MKLSTIKVNYINWGLNRSLDMADQIAYEAGWNIELSFCQQAFSCTSKTIHRVY